MGLLKASIITVIIYYIYFIFHRMMADRPFFSKLAPYIPMISIFMIELLL